MKVVDQLPRAVREIENLWIPLPDGDRMAARIWLPEDADADPVPAIVEYHPYRKRDLSAIDNQPMHGVPRGPWLRGRPHRDPRQRRVGRDHARRVPRRRSCRTRATRSPGSPGSRGRTDVPG